MDIVSKYTALLGQQKLKESFVRDMAGGSGAGSRRAMDASRGGAGVLLWIDRG